MKKSEFAEKYNFNLEDAKRDLEAKLDKIDRNKGALAHKAENQSPEGNGKHIKKRICKNFTKSPLKH